MGKYEKVVVYAPVDEISRPEWDEKVNGQKIVLTDEQINEVLDQFLDLI